MDYSVLICSYVMYQSMQVFSIFAVKLQQGQILELPNTRPVAGTAAPFFGNTQSVAIRDPLSCLQAMSYVNYSLKSQLTFCRAAPFTGDLDPESARLEREIVVTLPSLPIPLYNYQLNFDSWHSILSSRTLIGIRLQKGFLSIGSFVTLVQA